MKIQIEAVVFKASILATVICPTFCRKCHLRCWQNPDHEKSHWYKAYSCIAQCRCWWWACSGVDWCKVAPRNSPPSLNRRTSGKFPPAFYTNLVLAHFKERIMILFQGEYNAQNFISEHLVSKKVGWKGTHAYLKDPFVVETNLNVHNGSNRIWCLEIVLPKRNDTKDSGNYPNDIDDGPCHCSIIHGNWIVILLECAKS